MIEFSVIEDIIKNSEIDYNNHSCPDVNKDRLIEIIEITWKYLSSRITDDNFEEYFNLSLRSYDINDCDKCGKYLKLRYVDNTLKIVEYKFLGTISTGFTDDGWNGDPCIVSETDPCIVSETDPCVVNLTFETGRIRFLNYIPGISFDSPIDEQYKSNYCLNNKLGRDNITKHNASFNVGYHQTSNMSVYCYINSSISEILIFSEELENTDLIFIGEIECVKWRWVCYDLGDHDKLKKHTIEYTKNENKYHKISEERFDDLGEYFDVNIKPGLWELTNYNNWELSDNCSLISKLSFIG